LDKKLAQELVIEEVPVVEEVVSELRSSHHLEH
jgi:hypothetical protein